jgi:hypothetical protein
VTNNNILTYFLHFHPSTADERVAAKTFNANTHTELFVTTFGNLNVDDIADFAIGQVADSTALNAKIAQLLKIEHIAMEAAAPKPVCLAQQLRLNACGAWLVVFWPSSTQRYHHLSLSL